MKRFLVPIAAVALALAGLAAAGGSAQNSQGRALALFEDVAHESNAFVDNPPRSQAKNPESRRFRLSLGDEVTARTPVLDRRGGKRVGASYAHAVVVKGRRFQTASLQGDVMIALGDGTIALTGIAGIAQRPFAVVGGTGAYEGARGTAVEKEISGGAELTIRLLP
jgi:hypothetical protein